MTDTERVELLKRMGFGGMDETLISKLRRPDTKLSQNERIVEYAINRGGITSYDATNILKIMSFTKRMSEIRKDPRYEVTQRWESNGHTKWMLYEIKEVENAV